MDKSLHLTPRTVNGGRISPLERGWRLSIQAGRRGVYRLAQLDDYASLPRRWLPWVPPLTLRLRARASAADLPGTWGFGFWNNPFGLSLGFGGTAGRLPALPETAWFFYASPENHLALRDDPPAQGFFAGTFRSNRIPAILLSPALLALPFAVLRPISRIFRRAAGRIIGQEGAAVDTDPADWHVYSIDWQLESVSFTIDGQTILQTELAPHPPLGLVLWIDNQFAAWRPDGKLGYGTLENQAAWLDIESLDIDSR